MSEFRHPVCPICKEEVLLPFSVFESAQHEWREKTYGSWVCTNCGFYISTGDSKGSNPKKDINAGFLDELKIKIEDLRKVYHNKMPTT